MSNIPTYVNNMNRLKERRQELVNEATQIDAQINKITAAWQAECSHPKEYIQLEACIACGKEMTASGMELTSLEELVGEE